MSLTNRQRAVPPAMFTDETLIELSPMIRLTGLGLRFYVDDEGRGSATPALIRGQLWPLDPTVTDVTIREHLRALAKVGYIETYSINGRKLLALADWPAVDRGQRSSLPPPPSFDPHAKPSRGSRETFAVGGEGEGGRGPAREGEAGTGAGRGSGDASRDLRGTPEPSPYCKKHQPAGTESNCWACKLAREKHEDWLAAQVAAEADDLGAGE